MQVPCGVGTCASVLLKLVLGSLGSRARRLDFGEDRLICESIRRFLAPPNRRKGRLVSVEVSTWASCLPWVDGKRECLVYSKAESLDNPLQCFCPGRLLLYQRLMGMCHWMESHFHDWNDYNGVAHIATALKSPERDRLNCQRCLENLLSAISLPLYFVTRFRCVSVLSVA